MLRLARHPARKRAQDGIHKLTGVQLGRGRTMSPYFATLVYFGAAALAVVLLFSFESRAWYWHASGLALAFAIGFMPTPSGFDNPVVTVVTGFAIVFFLFWGLGGLLLQMAPHRHKHA